MPDNFAVINTTIAADVPPGGSFDVSYPAGTDATMFNAAAPDQVLIIINDSNNYQGPDYVSAAYGAAITITNEHDSEIWRAGSSAIIQVPKTPVFADAAATVDKMAAVIGAGTGITPLAADADLATAVGKINELVAAYQAV